MHVLAVFYPGIDPVELGSGSQEGNYMRRSLGLEPNVTLDSGGKPVVLHMWSSSHGQWPEVVPEGWV